MTPVGNAMTQQTYGALLAAAAERAFPAASMRGLKGAARRNADLSRSAAIHAERVRCDGLTEEQGLALLARR